MYEVWGEGLPVTVRMPCLWADADPIHSFGTVISPLVPVEELGGGAMERSNKVRGLLCLSVSIPRAAIKGR